MVEEGGALAGLDLLAISLPDNMSGLATYIQDYNATGVLQF